MTTSSVDAVFPAKRSGVFATRDVGAGEPRLLDVISGFRHGDVVIACDDLRNAEGAILPDRCV
jgi:hypothetical protein